jgi:uncharacterized membrane protein YfcA
VSLGRVALGWAVVAAWLLAWHVVERRIGPAAARSRRREPRNDAWWVVWEALLLVLLAALWYGSLGAGMGWLVFLFVGALMEWPVRTAAGAARVARVMVAGVALAWILAP